MQVIARIFETREALEAELEWRKSALLGWAIYKESQCSKVSATLFIMDNQLTLLIGLVLGVMLIVFVGLIALIYRFRAQRDRDLALYSRISRIEGE